MRKIHRLPITADTVVEQAASWITKVERGLSPEEERALQQWLLASRAHHREFLEMAKLWDKMESLERLACLFPEPLVANSRSAVSGRRPWAIAAMFALAVSITFAWSSLKLTTVFSNTSVHSQVSGSPLRSYETAIGEQQAFALEDGTRVVLNTYSLIHVSYSDLNRILTLERGEIHVSVAHDPARPLSVVVGDTVVQAVGTEFNVEITSGQNVELVVTNGVVMIGVLDADVSELSVNEPVLLSPSSTLVASGQEVRLQSAPAQDIPIEMKPIEAEEIAVRLSWRNGNLIFRGESLEEAVTEIGRYTAVEFVFLDEDSKKVRLLGMFRAGDVDGLLTALRKNFNISYEWVNDGVIHLSAQQTQ